jgi:hypothetical protein
LKEVSPCFRFPLIVLILTLPIGHLAGDFKMATFDMTEAELERLIKKAMAPIIG